MKVSQIPKESFQKVPQTQFVTKDLLKAVVAEYFQENPEILTAAITAAFEGLKQQGNQLTDERLEYIQISQANDRKRLSDIELLLGLDQTLQDPESPFYDDNKERYKQLFLESVFSNMVVTQKSGNVESLLYSELKKNRSMRNKDILNFLGWEKSNAMKVTRLMKEMPKTYPDLICDYVPGKKRTLRLYVK